MEQKTWQPLRQTIVRNVSQPRSQPLQHTIVRNASQPRSQPLWHTIAHNTTQPRSQPLRHTIVRNVSQPRSWDWVHILLWPVHNSRQPPQNSKVHYQQPLFMILPCHWAKLHNPLGKTRQWHCSWIQLLEWTPIGAVTIPCRHHLNQIRSISLGWIFLVLNHQTRDHFLETLLVMLPRRHLCN